MGDPVWSPTISPIFLDDGGHLATLRTCNSLLFRVSRVLSAPQVRFPRSKSPVRVRCPALEERNDEGRLRDRAFDDLAIPRSAFKSQLRVIASSTSSSCTRRYRAGQAAQ